MQAGRELPDTRLGIGQRVQRVDVDTPAAAFERGLDRLQHAGAFGVGQAKAVRHHVQHLAFYRAPGGVGFGLGLLSVLVTIGRLGGFGGDFDLAFGLYPGITADRQPLRDFFHRGVHRQLDRKGHHQTRVFGTRKLPQLCVNRIGCVVPHGLRGIAVEQLAGTREQQLQMVVQFGHGADCGARRAHRVGLVDGDGRRNTLHLVHRRLVHTVQKLPGVSGERLDVTALPFGEQGIENQAGLARPAGAGDHRQFAGADVEVEVLEVVLARSADADDSLGHCVVALVCEAKHSRQHWPRSGAWGYRAQGVVLRVLQQAI